MIPYDHDESKKFLSRNLFQLNTAKKQKLRLHHCLLFQEKLYESLTVSLTLKILQWPLDHKQDGRKSIRHRHQLHDNDTFHASRAKKMQKCNW